jgi:hypothetical protein
LAEELEIERSTEELDKLADHEQTARNSERPMEEEKTPPVKEEVYEFSHNGKTVKGNKEQFIKWASMGYDRPQFQQKINQERTKWEEDKKNWENKWGVYRQIDEYANQNKSWWDFIQQQWNSRGTTPQAAPQVADPLAPKFQSIEEKLSKFEQFLQTQEEQKVLAQKEELDQNLETEIQSLRQAHKDLDWDTLDENGKSLELRILEHADSNGISSVRAAMRDLLHDDLVQKAQSAGKIAVSKNIQAKTKLGVLGESPTPQRLPVKSNKQIRDTSYEEIMDEIREELRGRA